MANYTLNYRLYKPDRADSEQVDVTLASNFETIDKEIKYRKDELDGHKIAAVAHNSSSILHGEGTVESAFGEMNARIIEVETNVTQTANESKDIAYDTQAQLDRVVAEAGSNNPEVVQARGNEVNLNARLDKLAEIAVNVKSFGAKGDGTTDDIQAIQAAINTGKPIYFPEPSNFYNITNTIVIKYPGQILFSNSRKRGMIRNVTNEKQLVVFGDTSKNDGATPQAGIKGLTFQGNPLTVGGIRLDAKFSSNPNWADASKDCLLQDIVVDGVGNGWALEVYSWCNEIQNFTAYTGNKKGALFAKEHNQNNIQGLYITGCAEESLQIGDGTGLRGRGNTFNGIVVQQSGGAEGCITVEDSDNLVINGIYLEKNNLKGSPVPVLIKESARGTVVTGVNNLAGGALVIRNKGIGTFVKGVVSSNVTGTIVENSGNGQMIAELIEWLPDATATVPKFSDLSTNKTGIYLDSIEGFNKLKVTSFDPSAEFIDKSAGAYAWQQYFDGTIAYLKYDATKDGVYEGTAWRFNASVPEMIVDGGFRPETDNTRNLGSSTRRWQNIYAGTGSINTSDRNAKTLIGAIPDEVLDAWAEVNYSRFKFIDMVELKGGFARWHIGVIAQEIEEAFYRHGLSALAFGLLCYDEWEDQYEEIDGERVLVTPAGSRYSIRPDECLMLEAALMRREIQRLKA